MDVWNKVELRVQEVAQGVSDTDMYMVLLREVGGRRVLPVLLNREEALVLSAALGPSRRKHAAWLRTMRKVTSAFGILVDEVVIDEVRGGTYRVQITCYQNGQMERVRTTAADGILMAVNYRCPLYIRPALLDRQVFPSRGNDSVSIPINTLTMELLEEALSSAIRNENYELASLIRDEIKRRK